MGKGRGKRNRSGILSTSRQKMAVGDDDDDDSLSFSLLTLLFFFELPPSRSVADTAAAGNSRLFLFFPCSPE